MNTHLVTYADEPKQLTREVKYSDRALCGIDTTTLLRNVTYRGGIRSLAASRDQLKISYPCQDCLDALDLRLLAITDL